MDNIPQKAIEIAQLTMFSVGTFSITEGELEFHPEVQVAMIAKEIVELLQLHQASIKDYFYNQEMSDYTYLLSSHFTLMKLEDGSDAFDLDPVNKVEPKDSIQPISSYTISVNESGWSFVERVHYTNNTRQFTRILKCKDSELTRQYTYVEGNRKNVEPEVADAPKVISALGTLEDVLFLLKEKQEAINDLLEKIQNDTPYRGNLVNMSKKSYDLTPRK